MSNKYERGSAHFRRTTMEQLRNISRTKDVSMSSIVRRAVREWLEVNYNTIMGAK